MSQLKWCLDASPFWEASAAFESAESPVSGDYMHVYHHAALGFDFLLVELVRPFPFPFLFFNFYIYESLR